MKNLFAAFLLVFSINVNAQLNDLDIEFGAGYNLIFGEPDLEGSNTTQLRYTIKYKLSENRFIKTGIGINKSEVIGIHDYSLILGCDISDGTIDAMNSYYELGNVRTNLIIPILFGFTKNRYEFAFGPELMINVNQDLIGRWVECGERVDALTLTPFPTWEENKLNVAANAELSIGLFKTQRIRVIPRMRYIIFGTEINQEQKFSELHFELGLAGRLWKKKTSSQKSFR